jgi:hypothetical protein
LCSHIGVEFVLGHALYMKAIHGGKVNDPVSRFRFSFNELIVNPFPRSAPRRSAIVTEPA